MMRGWIPPSPLRVSESYVYRELITGDPPDATGAGRLLRLLLR